MADRPSALGVFVRGFCMGAADAVPGVSGGTIALITGIYDRLIAALTAVTVGRIERVLLGSLPGRRADAVAALREMDAGFLAALGVGVLTAIVVVSGVIERAVTDHPVPTFAFFFGLIAASAYVLRPVVSVETPGRVGAGIAGFLFAVVVSGAAASGVDHALPLVFLAGVVAVSAMILPGVSGSLLLLILGQYRYLVRAVSALREGVVAAVGGDPAGIAGPATVVGVFVAGAVTGLFTVSHAVRRALATHREATLTFLVALVVGALRAPLLRIEAALAASGRGPTPSVLGVAAAAALAGAVLVLVVERRIGGLGY